MLGGQELKDPHLMRVHLIIVSCMREEYINMSGLGHIGELQVIDYLEKNEKCSIFLPMKDKGIDFIAVRNTRSVQVQVKTSKFHKNSYFWFDLSIKKMGSSPNQVGDYEPFFRWA